MDVSYRGVRRAHRGTWVSGCSAIAGGGLPVGHGGSVDVSCRGVRAPSGTWGSVDVS